MKPLSTKPVLVQIRALLLMSALLGAAQWSGAAGTTTWSGAGADKNWSTAGNWFTAGGSTPPATAVAVVFGVGAFPASTNTVGAINNLVGASTSIAALNYINTNGGTGNFYHTTQIAAGQTLTINGSVLVGVDNCATKFNLSGPGNFTVAGGASSIFGVGVNAAAPYKQTSQTVTLVLGDGNNTIATASNLICYAVGNNTKPWILSLGNGANVLNSDLFVIGSGKDRGTLNFAAAGAGRSEERRVGKEC